MQMLHTPCTHTCRPSRGNTSCKHTLHTCTCQPLRVACTAVHANTAAAATTCDAVDPRCTAVQRRQGKSTHDHKGAPKTTQKHTLPVKKPLVRLSVCYMLPTSTAVQEVCVLHAVQEGSVPSLPTRIDTCGVKVEVVGLHPTQHLSCASNISTYHITYNSRHRRSPLARRQTACTELPHTHTTIALRFPRDCVTYTLGVTLSHNMTVLPTHWGHTVTQHVHTGLCIGVRVCGTLATKKRHNRDTAAHTAEEVRDTLYSATVPQVRPYTHGSSSMNCWEVLQEASHKTQPQR